jgi:HSP20 family protein
VKSASKVPGASPRPGAIRPVRARKDRAAARSERNRFGTLPAPRASTAWIEWAIDIKAELPEIRKEDVKVTIEEGLLTIEGERKHEKEEKTRKIHRIERSFGKLVRRFTVPPEAENAKAVAEFKDGVLYVHVPKSPVVKPKTIE